MFCRKCGNKIQNGAKFCNICGKKIQRKDESTRRDNGIKQLKPNQNYYEHRKGGADSIPFSRPPRVIVPLLERTIDIENPPAIAQKPEINWISVFLPPIAMAVLLVAISYFTDNSSSYMFMMLPMQAISVIIAIVNYWLQVRKHKKAAREREIKYSDYLAGIKDDLGKSAVDQLKIMQEKNPSPVQCMEIVLEQGKSLWERKPEDSDFCTFRLGTGTVEAVTKATYPKPQLSLSSDPLEDAAIELCDSYKEVANAPIVTSIRDGIIGIVGDSQSTKTLAQKIIVQLSTLHSYEDLKLGLICQQADIKDWAWVRWLRHFRDVENDRFLFAITPTEASQIKEILLNIVNQRKANERGYGEFRKVSPQYILFITAPDMLWDRTLFDKINQEELNLGVSLVILSESIEQLPKSCKRIIEIHGASGETYPTNNRNERTRFAADLLHFSALDAIARAMAPVYLSEASLSQKMPEQISFFEGYGLKQITDYDLAAAWASADVRHSLAAPIGIDENGNLFSFDICDGKMGVHGLVGGMSGSGKSEMIQSWILSMAMNYSPQDVSFVLIDFKGTGLITPFVGLPHLAGTISDINVSSNIRRSKESLEFEMKRREILFDKFYVSNIQSYMDLYNDGKAKEKLPILIVVIDEFAEFKKTFPEFMNWVESSFARGRSVGIWFILATQQPGIAVSPAIERNTHFKWCLKVNTASASKEMIGIPDAAQITRPGRGYIRVKNPYNDFTKCIQSFWSGAPYTADRDEKSEDQKIAVVDLYGNRVYPSSFDGSIDYKTSRTEIEVAVAFIANYAKKNGIPPASRVWTEPLGERFPLSAVCKHGYNGKKWPETHNGFAVTIGEVDDPKHQRKYPLVVPFTDCGHIVLYGAPVTGKTTFLQTLIMSSALNYSPQDLNIYIMDFGSLSMRIFSAMPQVGGIVEMGQDERIRKLANLLLDELERRKNVFSKFGVGSISAYKDLSDSEPLPYILLAVDSFKAVLTAYPELDLFFTTLTQSGSNYGIFLAATATGVDGFPFKLQPNIKMAYALRLSNIADYKTVVGNTDGLVPEDYMGRGLLRGDPAALQFQTALPADGASDNEVTKNIRESAEQMRKNWSGKCAKRIPEMPETIEYGSIDGEGIHIGLSTSKVEPVDYDYTAQHYLVISGTPGSGKSNLLKALAYQMHESANCTVYALDLTGNGLKPLQNIGTYISDASKIEPFFDDLMPALKKRQDSISENVRFAPILLVIDDFTAFYSAVSEKTVRRLLAIIKLCAGLEVYLLAAADAGELAIKRTQGEEVTMSLVSAKQAVLLGGYVGEHGAFNLKPTKAQRDTELQEKEGFFVSKSGIVRMKTMREKRI